MVGKMVIVFVTLLGDQRLITLWTETIRRQSTGYLFNGYEAIITQSVIQWTIRFCRMDQGT